MKKTLLILLCMGAFISAAHADTVPEYALDKDFTACMGGETPQKDPQRAQYCNCVRDSMKSWSVQEYEQVASEGAKAHDAAQEPAKLQDIAKACITKVLGPMPQ
jgi:hypothetical protein